MNDTTLLAETLAKCGLAMSSSEALRMANDITTTEKQVTKTFIEKTGAIENSYTRKKTYQEEIDELIQKTSPEKKNFHYMVRGYKEDDARERRGEDRSVGSFKPVAQVSKIEEARPAIKQVAKPATVFTDALDDDSRSLKEVMSGEQVLITVKPQEEGVFKELEEPSTDYSKEDDFLMPIETKPEPVKVPEKQPEKPKEFKNPIPKVDILSYFKKV